MLGLFQSAFVRTLIERVLLLPAVVTAIYGFSLRRLTGAAVDRRGALWAAGLLAGFFGGYAVTYRDFSFPPRTVLSWLPLLAVGAAVVIGAVGRHPGKFRVPGARALIVAASTYILLRPVLQQEPGSVACMSWLGAAALWFLLWSGLALSREDQRAGGVAVFVVAAGLALVAPLSGSIEIAQFSASLATVLAVGLVFSLFLARTRWNPPTADVAILILGALMVDLRFYADAPWTVMAWLVAAPAVACLVIGWMHRRSSSRDEQVIGAGLAALLPVAVALWKALRIYHQGGGY
ncbi:MAG: hypothetical protein M0Z84_02825 [Gammaproteobacteria bacterium]|nr:hypothetical protein [Gammaproteobacteria bacterium]